MKADMEEQEKIYYDANDVQKLLNVKRTRAYAIIKELNANLEKAGKLVIRGRVNKRYLLKMIDVSDIG